MTVIPQQVLPWEPQVLQHLFASPSSSHAPASLHITHSELSPVAPALCGVSVGSKPSCRTLSDTFPSKASALCKGQNEDCLPNKHIHVVCLFLIPMEALTQGNLWGSANEKHGWDGPQQGVMDCPLGSAQLNQPLPSPMSAWVTSRSNTGL